MAGMLPDILSHSLPVVFCGTAAGAKSAKLGAYYAGPGNSFWKTLYETGLTGRQLKPHDASELLRYEIGLTDLVKTAAGMDRDLPKGALGEQAREGLRALIQEWAPLDPEVVEEKFYASGVGLVLEVKTQGDTGRVELISFTPGT